MEGTSFPSGGFAFAGSSGCLPLDCFEAPARTASGGFRTAGSGGVAALDLGQPKRSDSIKFFGDDSPADLLDEAKLAERHRKVQGTADDLSPVSDVGAEEAAPSVVQQAVQAVQATK